LSIPVSFRPYATRFPDPGGVLGPYSENGYGALERYFFCAAAKRSGDAALANQSGPFKAASSLRFAAAPSRKYT